jgi:hypothetical protein
VPTMALFVASLQLMVAVPGHAPKGTAQESRDNRRQPGLSRARPCGKSRRCVNLLRCLPQWQGPRPCIRSPPIVRTFCSRQARFRCDAFRWPVVHSY